MATPTRAVVILFVVIGIFLAVALTLYHTGLASDAYATGGSGGVSTVPNMFNLSNIDCAIHSGPCDILHDKP
jgi:hypothetical protein